VSRAASESEDKPKPILAGSVTVGSIVEVERAGEMEVWAIHPAGGSNPEIGIISEDAPLARALIGAQEGEMRSYSVGVRVWVVAVTRIQRIGR
jgi:transcription elongation GreA/GreB family factor